MTLLCWVIVFLLSLALVYACFFSASQLNDSFFLLSHRSVVEYSVAGVLVSPAVDWAVWAGSVFSVAILLLLTVLVRSRLHRVGLGWVATRLVLVGLAFLGILGPLPLALATFLLVALFLSDSEFCFEVPFFSALKSLVLSVVLVFAFIEAGALVLFNVPAVLNFPAGSLPFGLHWQLVALGVSNLVYPFLPYVYFVFLVLGVIAFLLKAFPVAGLVARWRSSRFLAFARRFVGVTGCDQSQNYAHVRGRFAVVLALLVSIVVSCLLVVVTVLPWVNPTYRLVSADAPVYYGYILHMRGLDVSSAAYWAFGTDRPVFFGFLAFLSYLVSPLNLVQLLPALLIPLFSIVSVLFLRVFCPFHEGLVYTALLAPFSLTALGLLYSGYFANILALILVYVYCVLLVKFFHGLSTWAFSALLVASVLVLFSHLATWLVFAVSLVAFLFLEWRLAVQDRGRWQVFRWKLGVVGGTIAVDLVCELVRHLFVTFSTVSFVTENVGSTFGFPNLGTVLSGLRVTTDFYLGGVFGLAPFVFLSIVGFLYVVRIRSLVSNLLVSWVFVSSVYMLFGSGEYVFNRFLFMMPTLIFSGLGLSFLVRYISGSVRPSLRGVLARYLLVLFVFLIVVNFGLNYVLNLNTV